MTLFNPFAGLLITFPIGEGLLDYCFSFFACNPEDLLDSALETLDYNNISKDITTPKARNKDELQDLECEYMRRSIVALDPYMYRSLYSSVFPPELEEISETSLKYYIFYLMTEGIALNCSYMKNPKPEIITILGFENAVK